MDPCRHGFWRDCSHGGMIHAGVIELHVTPSNLRTSGDVDAQDALLAGMMSPPSGYSSGPDEGGAGTGDVLSAVRDEVDRLKVKKKSGSSGAVGCRQFRFLPASSSGVGAVRLVARDSSCIGLADALRGNAGVHPQKMPLVSSCRGVCMQGAASHTPRSAALWTAAAPAWLSRTQQ